MDKVAPLSFADPRCELRTSSVRHLQDQYVRTGKIAEMDDETVMHRPYACTSKFARAMHVLNIDQS